MDQKGEITITSNHALLYDALTRFAGTLADHYDVSDVLYGLTDHTVEVLDATCAGVSLADDTDGSLNFVSSSSDAAAELEHVQQNTGQGPCFHAFETGTAAIVDDISQRSEWPDYRAVALHVGLHAVVGIPMAINARRLGALNVYNTDLRQWTDDDIDLAWVLANMATSYVLHASRYAEAQRVNEQLQHALTSRVTIEQAKGLLAGELGISLERSFELIRHHARNNNASIHLVAESVIKLGLRPELPDH